MSDVFDMFGSVLPAIVIEPNPTMPPLPDEPRERFRTLLTYRQVVKDLTDRIAGLETQMAAEFETLMAAFPVPKAKGRKKAEKRLPLTVLGEEKYTAVRSRYEKIVEDLLDFRRAETERIGELLNQTADLIPLVAADPDTGWVKREVVWSSTYNTQGWGAHTYARNNAESKAEHYVMVGLKAEVRVVWARDKHAGDPFFAKSDLADYEVWVQSSEEDAEIAFFKSGMTLKDWLQWCWDRAVNPRVLNPWLPHGLEERLGVVIGRIPARKAV